MNARRWWIGIIGGGLAAAAGIGTMIYLQYGKIAEARTEVANLKSSIESASKLIEGTAAMEREVIVLREISEVMKQILPDNDDVNNLVRTFQKFSEDSEVRISGLKKKNADARDKSEFDKVAYTLSLEGDAFQLLGFLNLIEGHSRFMRVPNFRITAAQRSQLEASGVPAHKVQVDVETYVYDPKKDAKPVKIDSYDRKRDLLMGEINRRRLGLSLSTYSYRGARGRRDPWIDPRVPVLGEDVTALSVQQQMDMVQNLADRTQQALGKWEQIKQAENVIVEMMTRSELEELMSGLEEEIRRLEAENSIRYVPSQRRLQSEVVDVLTDLRTQLVQSDAGRGPSEKMLREVEETMVHHQERSEYKLMLDAFALVENQLALVESDPLRKPLADRVKGLALEAKTVIDFEKIQLKIGGRAIIDGLPATVVINGKPLGEGDMLNNELVVHAIRKDEIEFMFRGFIFAWRF